MTKSRSEILYNLKEKNYDIVIIGGGVIGATIALKAARAGLSTMLLEKGDFCSGSSSKTSKMFTGFITEMNAKNIFSTITSLKERNRLMSKSASKPISIVSPVYEYGKSTLFKKELKVIFYEALSLFSPPKFHKSYSRDKTLSYLPDLVNNDVIGSVEYYEGVIDDARYVIELLLKAEAYGADILNYAEVTGFDYTENIIRHLVFADATTRRVYELKAKNIVIAAGAWGKNISSLLPHGSFEDEVRYVKGTSIVVNSGSININKNVMLPKTHKRLNIFLLKWKDSTIMIGPMSKTYNGCLDCQYAMSDEVEYLLDVYNTYFSSIVNKNHIITTQSGMYPEDKHAYKIHNHPKYNLYVIEGGSFTTSSFLATKTLKEIYGKRYSWNNMRKIMHSKCEECDWVLSEETVKFLIDYYGYIDIALRVNDICKNDSSLLVYIALDERVPKGLIHYFVKKEHAVHLDDVMTRRLRFILTEYDCGTLIAEPIAYEMARILGWDKQTIEWEIKRYRTEIKRNRISLF